MAPPDLFTHDDLEDWARHLGIEYDQFYETYYNIKMDEEWDEDEYREEVTYNNY